MHHSKKFRQLQVEKSHFQKILNENSQKLSMLGACILTTFKIDLVSHSLTHTRKNTPQLFN